MPIGIIMVTFGGVQAVLAACRHHVVNRAIRRGKLDYSLGLVAGVAVALVLIATVRII